jgi:hypothetical protein
MSERGKITDAHRRRRAVVYVRQSTPGQVECNVESAARQYALRERAVELGWSPQAVAVVDDDTGRSGSSADGRLGFKELVAEVGLGQVGIVLALEVSRLARSSADWHQLLDLCALTGALIADGVYSPADFNDRLLLGLKGTMEDFEGPNGLALSPNQRLLYVDDTEAGHVRRFILRPDWTLSDGGVILEPPDQGEGVLDGMKVDTEGNLWCTGPGGIWIASPEGELLGRIRTPEVAANLAWGGDDASTLFITASTGLYRIDCRVRGHVTYRR